MLKKFVDAKARIWGSEAYACTIVFDCVNQAVRSEGKFYAECESTISRRRLTEENHEEVLNDMFYDYCVEKASYMGVS